MAARDVCIQNLSEPLDGATTAKVTINAGDGNLSVDCLECSEQVLASGTLQYVEKRGIPTHHLSMSNHQATLELRGGSGRQPWFRLPWAACNQATEWQVHLNPAVAADIAAHTDGGNITLDLAGMTVTHVAADTGGGHIDVVLPDRVANFDLAVRTGAGNVTVTVGNAISGSNTVSADSGAGNVVVHVPRASAARIYATSGLGTVIVEPRFSQIDDHTYQSHDYDGAANKIDIIITSGMGNVSVATK